MIRIRNVPNYTNPTPKFSSSNRHKGINIGLLEDISNKKDDNNRYNEKNETRNELSLQDDFERLQVVIFVYCLSLCMNII